MPVEAKPLFRPDVLRARLAGFALPAHVDAFRPKLAHWAELLASGKANTFTEQEILPDFLSDFFCELLGYTRPADGGARYTISREKHVQVEGEFADAVLGDFGRGPERFIVALEGKGPRDPLDRPFGGRRMSAVDQGYRYAINLPCDWIIVTSIRQTRLYGKGTDQQTYERFDTEDLAADDDLLRRFVFLLAAERVVPETGRCHFDELRAESEQVGKDLTKEFYLRYAEMRQDAFARLCRDNPGVPRHDVLTCAQKLLDRVLFCAFCEDRGLLPGESLRRAYEHRDPYHPRPIWDNFRGLFGAINRGNAGLGIHAYNGGLFADDPVLDHLTVADEVCAYFRELGDYDYRPAHQAAAYAPAAGNRSLIDVDILGHIFEQSISDLENLRNELDALAEPAVAEKRKTRRKKEGAFYTPAFITRYIIEQALGGVLSDRLERLRQSHEQEARGSARKALADPRVYTLDALKKPERAALVRFWEAWQDELASVRLLDPACGSGAFLIEAFDQLHAAYQASNDRLAELRGHRTLFDLDKRILENNLYGVDLNEEAIEICRLSLWIKTAQRGKVLTSLDHTIRVGNSIVADPAYCEKAFDWQAEFPEVFAQGGFDAIFANPPYIRQEELKQYKPYWAKRFPEVFDSTADIYVYFYALALQLVRPGGRVAFISSNALSRSAYAEKLRTVLANCLDQFIDLGDTQVFSEAKDVYPAIVSLHRSEAPADDHRRTCTTVRLRRKDDPAALSDLVSSAGWGVPVSSLRPAGWEFDEPHIVALRMKILEHGVPLHEQFTHNICLGIKTGLNEAFIVESETKERLVGQDTSSRRLLKPFVAGQNIRRWYCEDSGKWLIVIPCGTTAAQCGRVSEDEALRWLQDEYPAIAEHLLPFADRARRRGDKGDYWWELRPCDYYGAFDQPKILYPDITKTNRFCLDTSGLYSSNTGYMLPTGDWFLLGVFNCKAIWFALAGISIPFGERAGELRYRMFTQYVERLPIPDAHGADRSAIEGLARQCAESAAARYALDMKVQHRLTATFDAGEKDARRGALNKKVQLWWDHSLSELGAALKASFKLSGNPFRNPRTADDWEPYLEEKRRELLALAARLADAESELNDRVCRLYGLTAKEITVLNSEVSH